MSKLKVLELLAGTTLKSTCRNLTGLSPDAAVSVIFTGSDTLVSSATAVDSGNGYLFAIHNLPNSAQWYVNRWHLRVGANTYSDAQYIKAIKPEAI